VKCSACGKDKPHVHDTDICQDCWDVAKAKYEDETKKYRHKKSIKQALAKRKKSSG
jgi:hypothetical protein